MNFKYCLNQAALIGIAIPLLTIVLLIQVATLPLAIIADWIASWE